MRGKIAPSPICDCHSHVYGPYDRFPLASNRAFNPPEAPIQELEEVWRTCAISRAVLIQGSAFGTDHRALLDAIARSPEHRRGVAILSPDVLEEEIHHLHDSGIRAMRLNWVRHLLAKSNQSETEFIRSAVDLAGRVRAFGWHVEVHVDAECLDLLSKLQIAGDQRIVIDHMARVDASLGIDHVAFLNLRRLLDRANTWVKISGADRLARNCKSISDVVPFISTLVRQAPEKCVWGLDWPHVNLANVIEDSRLVDLLHQAVPEEGPREKVLRENPARLYDFPA